jgi:hypothetical protein
MRCRTSSALSSLLPPETLLMKSPLGPSSQLSTSTGCSWLVLRLRMAHGRRSAVLETLSTRGPRARHCQSPLEASTLTRPGELRLVSAVAHRMFSQVTDSRLQPLLSSLVSSPICEQALTILGTVLPKECGRPLGSSTHVISNTLTITANTQ